MAAVELLASAVLIVEEEPKVSALPSIPTAVLGGVGVTERGPFVPTFTTSFDEWVEIYGGLTATADLTMAAMGYYLNGGATFWGKRTVHYSDLEAGTRTSAAASVDINTASADTAGSHTSTGSETFVFAPGDTLVLKVDGGGAETATFDASAGTVTGVGSTVGNVSDGETLLVAIDGGAAQTITFANTPVTMGDVVDQVNAQLAGGYADQDGGELRITSDRKGTTSRVQVTGGTAATDLGFAGTESDFGDGDVANIAAVTGAEIKTVVEADTTATITVETDGKITVKSPTVGAASSIQVDATSTADSKVGFDNAVHSGSAAGTAKMGQADAKYEGAYGNSLKVTVAAASSGDTNEFNLYVKEGSIVLEAFPNLSTVLTAERYWATFINSAITGSKLITVTDSLVGSPPANKPIAGDYTLVGGDDGLTSLGDNDFIGSDASDTGLYGLDTVENLTLLIVPGRATSAVHQAMLTYCEVHREGQVFAILDPPSGQSATQIVTYVKTTAALQQFSEFGAIYWPRIKIRNPKTSVFTSDADGNIVVAPSGWIAGVFARTDRSRPGGIYDPPAGVERGILYGCMGFETDEVLDKKRRDLVYPELINPLTTWSGAPRHIDGTKTLKSTGNFPTVAERRGVSFIERTLKIGLSFARHSNNTRELRRRCHRTTYLFLLGEMQKGAFRSDDPDRAFFVDYSDKLNPPNVVNAGQLKGRIGLATNKPTDHVILFISQDTRAIDEQLAELQSGR